MWPAGLNVCTGSNEPATCYKGIRRRSRVCHADSNPANCNQSADDCADPTNGDPNLCSHIDITIEGNEQVEYVSPAQNGALPQCGEFRFSVRTY